jgi:hypothetical protein
VRIVRSHPNPACFTGKLRLSQRAGTDTLRSDSWKSQLVSTDCQVRHSRVFILGWDNNSYGYHGDDGHSFACSGTGKGYGPAFTTGDVIGCGIDFSQRTAFYTKNGVFLGIAFRDLKVGSAFYPAVGLRSISSVLTLAPGEIVEANFGATPFLFDIDQYFTEQKGKIMDTINDVELPLGKNGKELDVNEIVLAYLVHNGYSGTAQKFMEDSRCEKKIEGSSRGLSVLGGVTHMESRRGLISQLLTKLEIVKCIEQGDISESLAELAAKFPGLKTSYPSVYLDVLVQQFVSLLCEILDEEGNVMVNNDLMMQLLEYGSRLEVEWSDHSCSLVLADAFSLIAYSCPKKSRHGGLFEKSHRVDLGERVNGAMLESLGYARTSGLEVVVRATEVCVDEILAVGDGSGAFMSIEFE